MVEARLPYSQSPLLVPSEADIERAAGRIADTKEELDDRAIELAQAKALHKAGLEAHQQALAAWLKLRAQRQQESA